MSKTNITASAVVIALAFSAMPMSLVAAEQTVSKANAKTLLAAQTAQQAKRCPEAITKSKEALANGEKNTFDSYVAYSIMAYCYQTTGNKPELFSALKGKLDTGVPQGAELNQVLKNMYGTAFELKEYAQAEELGKRLIRSGTAGPEAYDQVAVAMVQQNKQAEAIKFLSEHVAETEKRGQKPSEATLTRLRDLQEKSGNTAGASQTVEKLVMHYPKPEYWRLLTHSLARDPKLNDRQKMHVFRLRVATGTLKLCQDYTEMADFAVNSGLAGEGQKVIDQGLAAKVCTVSADQARLERLRGTAVRVGTEERARLAKLEADAKVAKTGEPDVAVGSSLFGFGEYPKAAEWLSRGVNKGGLKDIADAQLALGIAYHRAGNKAEALKTFNSIKATDPYTQRIVKLWTLYASSK
jgi:tetratricopeptide (TPR) repeat protein